jgi:hypothetical protein
LGDEQAGQAGGFEALCGLADVAGVVEEGLGAGRERGPVADAEQGCYLGEECVEVGRGDRPVLGEQA